MKEIKNIDLPGIIAEARKVAAYGDENLGQLAGRCPEKELLQDYYLGMIRRQVVLLNDIATLLEHTAHHNITSVFVLCRCLLDDFLHVFYLKLDADEQEAITALNADVHRQAFLALRILVDSNHKHFEGKYPHYQTIEEFEALIEHFKNRAENDIFFSDKDRFRFKRFKTLTDIAAGITDFELSKLSQRAYYSWKDTSEFVHYSNATFERELTREDDEHNLKAIEEVVLYAYNTVELSFRYFTVREGLELLVDAELKERYSIKYLND
jgi:hypothetical protein